jgi:hypothetical protein
MDLDGALLAMIRNPCPKTGTTANAGTVIACRLAVTDRTWLCSPGPNGLVNPNDLEKVKILLTDGIGK